MKQQKSTWSIFYASGPCGPLNAYANVHYKPLTGNRLEVRWDVNLSFHICRSPSERNWNNYYKWSSFTRVGKIKSQLFTAHSVHVNITVCIKQKYYSCLVSKFTALCCLKNATHMAGKYPRNVTL